MKIKKIVFAFTAVLAVSALFAFVGCSKLKLKFKPKKNKKEFITVGYSPLGAESDWRRAGVDSIKSTFTQENGYKLIFDDAQQNQENQFAAIRDFIQMGVDYIVLTPIVETGWEGVLGQAKSAGVPVILVDRLVAGVDELCAAWVGGNFLKEGEAACKWLEAFLKEKKLDKKEMRIAHIQGTLGDSAQIGRTKAFENAVNANPNWKIVGQQSGEFSWLKGREAMVDIIRANDGIDVVYAENCNMAYGAVDALKSFRKTRGRSIIVITFDAEKETLERIIENDEDENIDCVVESDPIQGWRVDEIIKVLESGETETLEKFYYTEESIFDKNGIGGAQKAEDHLASRSY